METNHKASTINMFWTGGWDSTFRLLQILLKEKKIVQTYYIIDPNRPSHGLEMDRMDKIRKLIYKKYPSTKGQFLQTIRTELSDVKKDAVIEKAFKQANEKEHLGSQYDWLARFCNQFEIDNMELCVQKMDSPAHHFRFSPFLERDEKSGKLVFKKSLSNEPEYILFKRFEFPILHMTKQDMLNAARQNGWLGIMKKTWFCHQPIFGEIPCGKCDPCQQTMNECGMRKRFPLFVRLMAKRPLSKILTYFRQ
ncbi:MAG: 7-cyano-7-deazaguanine synthase [Brevefilum sp.]|nr:7-cyano-7-deazaguanine synthase [Brevefilum sp.]